ncbi:MAG: flavodoxin family protein [Oscillospiraceae bacterium]
MKLLIHDLDKETFISLFPEIDNNTKQISNNGNIHSCIGCFGCWIKTPGECVIKDGYDRGGEEFGKCNELIIISKCTYGGFSPFVKNVLDRNISYIHPYFIIHNGQMHNKRRYNNIITLKVYFYGDSISDREKATAQKLVAANADNYDGIVGKVVFMDSVYKLGGVAL